MTDGLILGAIEHFRRIADATGTDEKYDEGFVDGLEFCISHLSTIYDAHKKDNRKVGYKINQHEYPCSWKCSERGKKHFDFGDVYCSHCGAYVGDRSEGWRDG